jgi:hypothetical protein
MSDPTIIRVTAHSVQTGAAPVETKVMLPPTDTEDAWGHIERIAEMYREDGIDAVVEHATEQTMVYRYDGADPHSYGDFHHVHIDADSHVWAIVPGDVRDCESPVTLAEPVDESTAEGYRRARETTCHDGWDALYLSGVAGSVPQPTTASGEGGSR